MASIYTKKLAYCPFCGHRRLQILTGLFGHDYVHCKKCGADVFFSNTNDEETLVKKWNKRRGKLTSAKYKHT